MISIAKHPAICVCVPVEYDTALQTAPRLIDDLDILDALCPVSKVTGLRENMLSLLRKVAGDPAKATLLNAALQVIPSVESLKGATDEQKVDYLVNRLDKGTPAEDDLIRSRLLEMIQDAPFKEQPKVDPTTIEFSEKDSPESNPESV